MDGIRIKAHIAVIATALTLSGCGGGGGGGLTSTPAPPASPTPTPTPGTTAIKIFPSITTSTTFAVLGAELGGTAAAPVTIDGYSVRYDAAAETYIFDLPTHAPGVFHSSSTNPNSAFWGGGLATMGNTTLWPPMAVLKPSPSNPQIQLSYTSYAAYLQSGPMEDRPHGFVAFGSATPASGIPTSGSATMNAIVEGMTHGQDLISGTATLQFNFGTGTLTGNFNPVLQQYYNGSSTPLGQYTFANTVTGVGSTTFSGGLVHANANLTGSFNGLFTGPAAQELMARWTATYLLPGQSGQPEKMFGIWVGKKCC